MCRFHSRLLREHGRELKKFLPLSWVGETDSPMGEHRFTAGFYESSEHQSGVIPKCPCSSPW